MKRHLTLMAVLACLTACNSTINLPSPTPSSSPSPTPSPSASSDGSKSFSLPLDTLAGSWRSDTLLDSNDLAEKYKAVLHLYDSGVYQDGKYEQGEKIHTKTWGASDVRALGSAAKYEISTLKLNGSYHYEFLVDEGSCMRTANSGDFSIDTKGKAVFPDIDSVETTQLTVGLKDKNGDALPNAQVELTHLGGTYTGKTQLGLSGENGSVTLVNLPYYALVRLVVTAPGYARQVLYHEISPSCQPSAQELSMQMDSLLASEQEYQFHFDISRGLNKSSPDNVKVYLYADHHLLASQTHSFTQNPETKRYPISFKKQDVKGKKVHFEIFDADPSKACPERIMSAGVNPFKPEYTQVFSYNTSSFETDPVVTLSGTIQNLSKETLGQAVITITTMESVPQVFSAVTLGNGQYLFEDIPNNVEVKLNVSKSGYKTLEQKFLPSTNRKCQLTENHKFTVLEALK